jgi:hypothetical protein
VKAARSLLAKTDGAPRSAGEAVFPHPLLSREGSSAGCSAYPAASPARAGIALNSLRMRTWLIAGERSSMFDFSGFLKPAKIPVRGY